ncbi:uncharacterized [Tachysurus ichikawai]
MVSSHCSGFAAHWPGRSVCGKSWRLLGSLQGFGVSSPVSLWAQTSLDPLLSFMKSPTAGMPLLLLSSVTADQLQPVLFTLVTVPTSLLSFFSSPAFPSSAGPWPNLWL